MSNNNLFTKVFQYIKDPDYRVLVKAGKGLYRNMPDEEYLLKCFKARLGYELNLADPKTFNEKIQWLKLYDRKDEYITMVDKNLVKAYVGNIIGQNYIIPTLAVWDSPDEIDFDGLPKQFVLKCNHNSGTGMYICKDKYKMNKKLVRSNLKKGMKEDYYLTGREWSYKHVKKKIIAEKYMTDESGTELKDYKLMVFNGHVRCEFVCSNRFNKSEPLNVTFYDRDWNILPFTRHYPQSKKPINKPTCLERMIELAEQLGSGIPFVRVDFYEVDGKIYFGEMTFFPGCGFEEFTPKEWDRRLGEWLDLTEVQKHG